MTIEFLYFDDCPSHGEALARLRSAMARSHREQAELRIIRVQTGEEARLLRFPGSPTIRIDGEDIDPAGANEPFGLSCRIYRKDDGGVTPLPPESLLLRALSRQGG